MTSEPTAPAHRGLGEILFAAGIGVFLLGEPMPPERWVGFGLVWVALVILTVDMVVTGRAPRRASPEPL